MDFLILLKFYNMKLFILNKEDFESVFAHEPELSKKIHRRAYNELKLSLDAYNSIPKMLTPNYDENGIVLFDFVSFKNETYFYSFTTTAK